MNTNIDRKGIAMIENPSTLTLDRGLSIYTQSWLPYQLPARANVILVHGLGEHCLRYRHVAEHFTGRGLAVYTFDQIGHGQSGGERGTGSYAEDFKIINTIKEQLKADDPEVPVFVYGHSLGGGIVLGYGYRYPENIRGVIATSPAVGMARNMPGWQIGALRVIEKIAPNFTIANGLDLTGLSHDPAIAEAYVADPLNHDRVSVRVGLDLIDNGTFLLENQHPYPVSLLVIQGLGDRLVDPDATIRFASNVKGGDVTFRKVENGYHELHNEPEKAEFIAALADWIEERC